MKIQSLCVSSALLFGGLVSSTQAQCSPTELDKYGPFSSENHSGGQFAASLGVSGDKAVVGAPGINSTRGKIFFYTIDGNQMIPQSSFRASGDASGDTTGSAVAIDGDIAVIGAPNDDDFGSRSGSAYIFRHDGVNWNQEAKLLPTVGESNDFFGSAVAIHGNTIVIGAKQDLLGTHTGSAYVFRYDGVNWVEEAKLLPSDSDVNDQFGSAVAIEGNTIVVCAENDDTGKSSPPSPDGSAYIFQFDGADWVQGQKLIGQSEDSNKFMTEFGKSVDISGVRIAIGQTGDNMFGTSSGAVYIYSIDGQTRTKITASDASVSDHFGYSVAIDGDTLVVGAALSDNQGAAYHYKFDGANWVESTMMVPADIAIGDSFGNSVAISGDILLIGARTDDDQGGNSGSFYVFDQGCSASCPADLTGEGTLNFFDISAFLAAFSAQDPVADFDGNGTFNFFDISAFLAAFSAGCP